MDYERTRLGILTLASIALLGACTSVTYSGPRRNSNEVALLLTSSGQKDSGNYTTVVRIDSKDVSGSKFEILAGRHRVEVIAEKYPVPGVAPMGAVAGLVSGLVMNAKKEESGPLPTCFTALPGHTYEVRTFGNSVAWAVEVVDQNTAYAVTRTCKDQPQPVAGAAALHP